MKKLGLVVLGLFLVSIFFVSGCVQQPKVVPKIVPTGGLSAAFSPGAPPTELPEGGSFDIAVILENKGEDMVPTKNAKVFIRGLNPASFEGNLEPQETQTDLFAVAITGKETIPGGMEILTWPGLTYLVNIPSDTELPVVAQTCYLYDTNVDIEGCFKSDAFAQTTGAETCKVQGNKTFKNSISPIKVVSAQENPAGKGKFSFIIKVANAGKGQVYDYVALNTDCRDATRQQMDKVYIESVKLGTKTLMSVSEEDEETGEKLLNPNLCVGWRDGATRPFIALTNGVGQLTCTIVPGEIAGEYTDVLRIQFGYGYTEQIRTKMTMTAIPGV